MARQLSLSAAVRSQNVARSLERGAVYRRDDVMIHFEDAQRLYESWPEPICIAVDGPHGVNGFPGDSPTHEALAEWVERKRGATPRPVVLADLKATISRNRELYEHLAK